MQYKYDGYPEHEARLTWDGLKHPYCCYENPDNAIPENDEDEERKLQWSVSLLNMPLKASNACKRNGIGTVGQLVSYSKEELISMQGIGNTAILYIEKALAKIELKLAERPPQDFCTKQPNEQYYKLPREGVEFESIRTSDV